MTNVARHKTTHRSQRRSTGVVGLALVAAITAGCGGAAAATRQASSNTPSSVTSSSGKTSSTASKDPANEICEDMTRTNVANQLSTGRVVGHPVRTKSGTITQCTYRITGGSLTMTVDERTTDSAARAAFDTAQRATGTAKAVPNLGTAAFTRTDGMTVTVQDNKVLTVDPAKLPGSNDKTQIAQSLSFEILTCWTG